MDWLDLLAVQGTQESSPTPQFKASILRRTAFLTVQLPHQNCYVANTIVPSSRNYPGPLYINGATAWQQAAFYIYERNTSGGG